MSGVNFSGIYRQHSFFIKFLQANLDYRNNRGRINTILILTNVGGSNTEPNEQSPDSFMNPMELDKRFRNLLV